jgi:hypothetical protein
MSERHGVTSGDTAKTAAAKRPASGRRKPAARGGSTPPTAAAPPPAVTSASAGSAPVGPGPAAESAELRAPRPPRTPLHNPGTEPQPQDRGLRRAIFLAELAEAKELRRRVAPRRARAAELHARLLRTFRY